MGGIVAGQGREFLSKSLSIVIIQIVIMIMVIIIHINKYHLKIMSNKFQFVLYVIIVIIQDIGLG